MLTTEGIKQGLADIDSHLPGIHSLLLLDCHAQSYLTDKMRTEKCPLGLVAWNSLGPWDNRLTEK